jgi:hypothetical protein
MTPKAGDETLSPFPKYFIRSRMTRPAVQFIADNGNTLRVPACYSAMISPHSIRNSAP